MSLLGRLEGRFGRWGIPNPSLGLVLGQCACFALIQLDSEWRERLQFLPERVIAGEWWRAFTFLFVPADYSALCLFFALYLFLLLGTSLETFWGTFRYNVYLLLGWLATLASGFIHPNVPVSSEWLGLSVFLAFAWLAPDFLVMLFFFAPVKIKYIAALTWGWYFYILATGEWATRAVLLASIANFLLFFGRRIWLRILSNKQRMEVKAALLADKRVVRHRCATCQKTDVSDPDVDFRYCSQCKKPAAYCSEHIRDHQHS